MLPNLGAIRTHTASRSANLPRAAITHQRNHHNCHYRMAATRPYAPPPPGPLGTAFTRRRAHVGNAGLPVVSDRRIHRPLIIYFVYRDRSNFVRETSKEALNLQITAAIVGLTALVGLLFFGTIFSIAVPPVGMVMFLAWFVPIIGYQIVVITFEIIGARAGANNGIVYRVPFILRLVK